MTDQIPIIVQSIYFYSLCAALGLLVVALVIRSRRDAFKKAWRPLAPLIQGSLKKERTSSTLTGTYHGHPVTATMWNAGKDNAASFAVQMPAGPGGRDWDIAHRSEKMLGPEMWRASTKDPALQSRLEQAGVALHLRGWPDHTVVRYDSSQGTLVLREELARPSAEHFKQQLELLETLVGVNEEVNG